MKINSKQVQFLILLVCLLLAAAPAVVAPSHPVYIDPETGETIDEILPDPGTTPDSFWYPVERWWERTFETNLDHTPERFAEMREMLTTGNTEAALRAGEEVRQTITFVQQQVVGAPLDTVLSQQEQVYDYENYLRQLQELGAPPDTFREIDDALTETGTLIELREGEIAEEIAAEQGLFLLEAEDQIEEAEEERFGEELKKRVTTENLQELQDQLQEAREQFGEAVQAGQEISNAEALGTLLEEATEKVLQAETAWEAGRMGRAYGLSTAAEHLIDNANRFLDEEVDGREERVLELANQIQQRDEARTQRLVEVVEQGNLLDSFSPEQRIQMEQAWKTHTLAVQRQEFQEEKRAQLLEEGKSNEEIARTLMEDFAQEYEHIYGEKYYIPPVATEPEVADERWWLVLAEEAAERLKETKGVVENIPYTDLYTGYEYTFTDEGYEFKTPLGIEHEVKTSEIKEVLQQVENPFETGTEVVSTIIETPEGVVEYRYTATGYEVRLPDGTTETKAYDLGKHSLPGGGLIEVKPYGFEVVKEGGERAVYDYHPEYKNFVSTDGYVYMPPEGTAIQYGTTYDYGLGNFKFDRPGNTWTYDAASKTWSEERAEVGRTIVYESKTYTVTADKGWTDENGKAVPPPPGQPSSVQSGSVFGSGTYRPITESFAPVGTTAIYDGKAYTVDAELGWSIDGTAVPPPPGQPNSAVGATGGFARVGTSALVDGKEFIVDPAKGWIDVESGRAVPPPRGYTSSAVGMRLGDFGIGVEKNYNFVEKGEAYYFPPGVDPRSVEKKSAYLVKDPRGYDTAFGTDFGGSGPGYSAYTSSVSYGHIKDSATGSWRPATREEAEQAQIEGKGGGENPTYSPSGSGTGAASRNYNYVEEGKAYYFPPGINPGTVTDKSSYVVGDPRGYDPAYNTYFGGQTGPGGTPGTPGSTGGYYGTPGTGGYYAGGIGGQAGGIVGHYKDASGNWQAVTDVSTIPTGAEYSSVGGGGATYGSWTSPEGGYTGGTYSDGAYGGTGGTYSGGSYSGGYTGGEAGSYGGSTGGSYGGDSGGSTGGSTGGDTGGSTGSTGGTVAKRSEQESVWLPITKWIYTYLGLKKKS